MRENSSIFQLLMSNLLRERVVTRKHGLVRHGGLSLSFSFFLSLPLLSLSLFLYFCCSYETKKKTNSDFCLTFCVHEAHTMTRNVRHIYIMLRARISLTFSRHSSISYVASGRSSKLHYILFPYRAVVDKF